MEKSKTVHVVELHGKAEKLQQTLADLKKDFSGMAMPKDLEKVFTKLENSLDTILRKTSKGVIPREDFQDTEKEIGKVRTAFDSLSTSMEGVRKASDKKLLQMIPEGITKKIEAATQAYAEYAKELAQVVTAERNLEAALEKKAEAEKKATSAQNSERAYKGKVTSANKELEKHKEITEALNKQTEATEALKKAEKELEDAKNSGKSEKIIANKTEKRDIAKAKSESADKVVDGFTQKDLKAQKDAVEKAAAAEEKYAIAKKNSESAQKALTSAEVAAQTATSDLNRAKNKSAEDAQKEANALNALRNALGAVNPKYKNMAIEGKTASQQLDFLRKTIDGLTDDELAKLKVQLGKAGTSFDSFSDHLQNTRDQLSRTKEGLKAADEVAAQQSAFEGRIKQFLGLSGAAEVLRRSLRNAMSTITKLDATMTEMAVVTDLSVGDYWDQLPEYSARANELGVAINDAYKSATLYYQQGLKTNEVNAISTETLKMAKIAGLSAADATNKMTAALRGFNMELNETSAKRVADVYSELAAITAADTKEIANAMTKTASIASSAGMEFETTAAFLSQIIETTRESAETAGTALKTVIARFQELKKDPSEIGEVDGEIVDANAIETALRSVGVALRDSSGQFRELDDVFLELSSKWNDLDKNTQRYIATIAAGSRQQSRFIAMMQDYERTQELVTAANNSAGASQKQFEKTTESLEYKINQLKNAWAEFTMGIMNSDLVKAGVDILTKLLTIINKATSGFNGLAGSITKIIGIVAVFKLGKTIFDKLRAPMVQFFADIVKEAGMTGERAGNAAKQGLERSKTQTDVNQQESKKTIKQKVVGFVEDKTGVSKFKDAIKANDEAKYWRAIKSDGYKDFYAKKQNRLDEIKNQYQFNDNGDIIDKNAKNKKGKIKPRKLDKGEAEQLKKEYADLNKEVEEYNNAEENYAKASKEKWDNIGQGVAQAGSLVTGAGMAMSALGGILSSIGLEEAGEFFSNIGNAAMIAGTAISSLGPAIVGIVGKLVAGGMSAAAAWIWVVAIAAAIAAITIAVIGIAKAINEASPEKKLKRAREEADAAADAADRMNEAYQNLKNSLESLEHAQDTLDGLTTGTDAWRDAVEKVNEQILELIKQYPELAQFVKHNNGVMTIDMDDSGVQEALERAKANANNASVIATGAELNVLQKQNDANYDSLSKKAKIDYVDPETAAALASAGAYTTAMGAAGTAGGFAGAAIGTAAPVIGNVVGAVAGAALGAIGGAIGVATTGAADAAAEAAAEAAEARNDRTQSTVEGIARALASGKLIDTGSGYKKAEGVTEAQLYELGLDENFNDFYGQLSDSTKELKAFGEELNRTADQAEKYYDSMATQIFNNMDKTGWSKKTETIADNILDGDTLQDRRESIEKSLKDTDFLNKKLDSDLESRMTNAIQDAYGAGAKLQKGENGYEIINDKGEVQMANVTSDAIRNIIATQEAKEQTENIGKIMPKVTEDLYREFGARLGDNVSFDEKAIVALFDNESGEKLTEAQMEMFETLSNDNKALEDIFNSSEALQKAFGSLTNFTKKIKTPLIHASDAFEQSAEVFNKINNEAFRSELSGLTSGTQKGLAQKLSEVYSFTGGGQGVEKIAISLNDLLSNKDVNLSAEEKESVVQRINMADWSNQESLLALQIDLEQQYGYTREQAEAYTSTLADAAYATSGLTTTVAVFGDFWKATEKVNQSMARLNNLQWEYGRALQKSGENIQSIINDMIHEYSGQADEYVNMFNASTDNIAKVYAQGATNYKVDLTDFVKLGEHGVSVDESRVQEAIDSGAVSQDEISTWLEDLNDWYAKSQDSLKGLQDSLDAIEELEEQSKEAYTDLRDMAKEAILNSLQKQIDLQKETLDATNDANSKILNKLQEQIDFDRQKEQNEKAEEDIAKMQSQAAYLAMDTSGANALQLLDLNQQIEQSEEDYTDTLIDQSIQKLLDANEEAAQQRERQIALAEAQLEIYSESAEFQADVDTAMRDLLAAGNNWQSTKLGELLADEFTVGMSAEEKQAWVDQMSGNIELANTWKTTNWEAAKTSIEGKIDAITRALNTFPTTIANAAEEKERTNLENSLKREGFSEDVLGEMTTDQMRSSLETIKSWGDTTAAEEEANKMQINSKKQYVKRLSEEIAKGEEVESYGSYVDRGRGVLKESAVYNASRGELNKDFFKFLPAAEAQYIRGGGTKEEFYKEVIKQRYGNNSRFITNLSNHKNWSKSGGWDHFQAQDEKGTWYDLSYELNTGITNKDTIAALDFIGKYGNPKSKAWDSAVAYKGGLYSKIGPNGGTWYKLASQQNSTSKGAKYDKSGYKLYTAQYKTGGLADFTGPAWLDGTPEKPEYILNAAQTERFFSLIDILEGYDKDKETKKPSGDNYFDININVEKLENDYDVEQIADKIRSMIYEDATYRNTNAINLIR